MKRSAIVDKASFDMLQRYPDLNRDMPRNQNGASTDGTERCKTDLGLVVDGLAIDENGGNKNVVTAADSISVLIMKYSILDYNYHNLSTFTNVNILQSKQ